MNKTVLLAAAAAFAMCAGGASAAPTHLTAAVSGAKVNPVFHRAKGATVLWNQNSNGSGEFVNSQNFTSGTYATYDDQSADDFVVPTGTVWKVTEVDVTGEYRSTGNAASENVFFYKNKGNGKKSMPGKQVAEVMNVVGTDTSGSFAISLGKKGVKLKAGHYWISVVANLDFLSSDNEWYWENTANTIQGSSGEWQNPGGGFASCLSWGTLNDCVKTSGGTGVANADFMFELQGKAKTS